MSLWRTMSMLRQNNHHIYMKMSKVQALICCMLLSATTSWAQLGSQPDPGPDLAVVREQPLVVILDDEDPKTLRQLADKPAELAQYKAYVAQHNVQLRELAPKLWKASPSVEFKPESEYKDLRKAKNTHIVVLHYTEYRASYSAPGPMGHRLETVSLGTYTARQMELDIVGEGDEHRVWRGPAPLGGAYAGDIATTLRSLQANLQLQAANAGKKVPYRQVMLVEGERYLKNLGLLRTKTLLLNQADLQDKLTEADIRKFYPGPVQVVPLQAIETAILDGDARYTYARNLAYGAGQEGPVVSDTATGTTLACLQSKAGIGQAQMQTLAQLIELSGRDVKELKTKDQVLLLQSMPH
jgi:hypothetical protein